jgi:opacity protein-like surface antigen
MKRSILLAAVLLVPSLANAQFYSGQPQWDWSIGAVYQLSETSTGSNGSFMNIEDEIGLGISFNYNFNRRFGLGVDLDWLSPDYQVELVSDDDPTQSLSIDHRASQWNGRIKGTLNFVEEGPLVPYAQLGIGWSWFDSNVADGPPQTGCWWHPWWGYICSNFYSTFSSTEFSYGAALGLRYVMRGGMTWKLSVNQYWLDVGSAGGDPELNAARLEIGWSF